MKTFTIWFTGLPSSGKTTLAGILYDHIRDLGIPIVMLDGDDVRKYVSPDLGYTTKERNKQMKRMYGINNLLRKNGINVIACTNTPPSDEEYDIKTIYVKCPVDVCKKRDVKGLYALAKKGKLINLMGFDLKYKPPKKPYLILETDKLDIIKCIDIIIELILGELYL